MAEFISNFVLWLGQFVVVSTVVLLVTHLFAKKRRAQNRHAEKLKIGQSDSEAESEVRETASVS